MLRGKKAAFYTLGCKLNFSETSTISRQLTDLGFSKAEFNEGADVFVINTCSVTENANRECRRIIRKAKKISPSSIVIVTGCYAQLKPEAISCIDGVDMVVGANEKFNIPSLLKKFSSQTTEIHGCSINNLNYFSSYSLHDRTRSFLKIQDGCDYPCTYCTIPLARGKSRSDTISNIVKNAEEIAKNGIKEIVLTGVNIGDFKQEEMRFIDLIKQLDQVNGIERYRISSIEPNLITDEIIDFVKDSKKFMPHFHIPLQSGSDNILKMMKRRYNTKLYFEKIKKIQKAIPNVCIGADVIVGFPGETDLEFNKTLNFIKNLNISYLHVFSYSERENTKAILLDNKVDKPKRAERSKMLRILSSKLQRLFYKRFENTQQTVLFEKDYKDGFVYGFTENYIKIKIPFDNNLVKNSTNVLLNEIDENLIMNAQINELCIQQ
ncbi:tRNA (N(6)-L-threonylcarbamoyladenosine(37)-C(2))-methylthiotransferase MtaB [bacterium]|nr:tRNA (N(6)-L-threonylcarbamoyladenosine(37)-C(2))-methylthiotransferase MtaB [bacterium]